MWWYWDRSREPLVCQRPAPYRTIRRCNLDVVVPGPNQKRTMAFALRSTAHSGWKVQPRLCRFARCSDSIAPTPCTIATAWRARPTTACRLRTKSVGTSWSGHRNKDLSALTGHPATRTNVLRWRRPSMNRRGSCLNRADKVSRESTLGLHPTLVSHAARRTSIRRGSVSNG